MGNLEFKVIAEGPARPEGILVLVHGLGGDPINTWRADHGSESKFWPDWIARDLRDLRVVSIGYPAAQTRWNGNSMWLEDRADSVLNAMLAHPLLDGGAPIAFAGHSLGGLVIKQALHSAEEKTRSGPRDVAGKVSSFLNRVSQVIFLATPHQGADLAWLADTARLLVLPSHATESLKFDAPALRKLHHWYRKWAVEFGIKHLVFAEDQETAVGVTGMTRVMVVRKASADPSVEVDPIPVDADHIHICKLQSQEDLVYKEILAHLSSLKEGRRKKPPLPPSLEVAPYKLPRTTLAALFGREDDLARMHEARASGKTRVIVVEAMGGVGKTALADHFLRRLRAEHYQGFRRVFTWSFYSQGTDEKRQASSQQFFDEAISFFGLIGEREKVRPKRRRAAASTQTDIANIDTTGSLHRKSETLLRLIRQHPALVVLDGLEPHQYPAGKTGGGPNAIGIEGSIKDDGLRRLVEGLAESNPGGLLIITTRVRARDLDHAGDAILRLPLGPIPLKPLKEGELSPAVQFLQHLKVRGDPGELQSLADDLGGHAIALCQFARLLDEKFDGDVQKRDLLPRSVVIGSRKDSSSPARVMRTYEIQFEEEIKRLTGSKGAEQPVTADNSASMNLTPAALATAAGRELAVLNLLGLFDRKISRDHLKALLKAPPISGLTEGILETELEGKLEATLNALRRIGLVAEKDKDEPSAVDCHPLVREYFGARIEADRPEAFKQANQRLYSYYLDQVPNEPQTTGDVEKLLAALRHGCDASRHQQAWVEVVEAKLKGLNAAERFGQFSLMMAALNSFFLAPYNQPRTDLPANIQYKLASEAGYALRTLGRLNDSLQAYEAAARLVERQRPEHRSAIYANLAETLVLKGRLNDAKDYARKSVSSATAPDELTRRSALLGEAQHLSGQLREAKSAFGDAIAANGAPFLPAWAGIRYCDLLLSLADLDGVAAQLLPLVDAAEEDSLECSLASVISGKLALLHLSNRKGERELERKATSELDRAVESMHSQSYIDDLPKALLARAVLKRMTGNTLAAVDDVTWAMTLAKRHRFTLFEIDCELELVLLALIAHAGQDAALAGRLKENQAPLIAEADQNRAAALGIKLKAIEKSLTVSGYGRRKTKLAILNYFVGHFGEDKQLPLSKSAAALSLRNGWNSFQSALNSNNVLDLAQTLVE